MNCGNLQNGGSDGGGLFRGLQTSSFVVRTGQLDDQWHAGGGGVDKKSVLILAVLAQRFAVIGHENNQGRCIAMAGLQPRDQAAKLRVGISDFAVVRM